MQEKVSTVKQESKVERLPSLEQAESRFKKELGTLSKRELIRQAANYYMRLTLSGFQVESLKKEVQKLTEQLAQKSES